MFSSSYALPSPTSAGSCFPLFGRFTGITAQSDFSRAYVSVVRLDAFADRPSHDSEGALEISRFSSMLFSQRAWVLRLRRTGQPLAIARLPYCLPPTRQGVGILICRFSKLNHPAHQCLRSTLRSTPHDGPRKTRGQDGIATSFPAGTFTPTTCRFSPAHDEKRPCRLLEESSRQRHKDASATLRPYGQFWRRTRRT